MKIRPFSFFFFSLLLSIPGVAQYKITVDVCVYGGTSAGVMAAYTAKKAGKSVVLIEPGRHLGGLTSGGLGATDIGNKFAITGLSRNVYRRIGAHYGRFEQWTFEPHVAENTFNQYVSEAKLLVWKNYRLKRVGKKGTAITEVELENAEFPDQPTNRTVRAKQFIDCSYEGDLMAKAGVSYTVGREANSQYNETYNGVQYMDKHQFPDGIDPYRIAGKPESGLLWGISTATLSPNGAGDRNVQAYNYRLCLTNVPANRIPLSRPDRYDSTRYELLLRQIAAKEPKELTWNLMHFVPMPNHKTDINNCGGFSTDMIGANNAYPDADYNQRKQIIQEHEDYTKGLLYFIAHDPRMPKHLREEMQQWGYPKDEYTDNNHFSHQLYIREARRMVGDYVMTQANCEGKQTVTDGVGMAAYTMDSHNCQRLVVDGPNGRKMVKNEGDVQVGGFPPYPVSYRSLIPKRGEATNLLVPVCLSASHIAYGSIRMEPVFMVLAQSAAMAAVMAINTGKAVQDIDVAKLQAQLRTNPLVNGSRPEVLVDNDDQGRVVLRGDWVRETKGGKYGFSMLTGDPAKPASAFFEAAGLTGVYDVYIYNPNRLGGGGNPDDPGLQTDKSDRVTVRVNNGRTIRELAVNQQLNSGDWIRLDRFRFEKGRTPYVEVVCNGNTGFVVADAVLFLPVN